LASHLSLGVDVGFFLHEVLGHSRLVVHHRDMQRSLPLRPGTTAGKVAGWRRKRGCGLEGSACACVVHAGCW
jgi:hypothetical protein